MGSATRLGATAVTKTATTPARGSTASAALALLLVSLAGSATGALAQDERAAQPAQSQPPAQAEAPAAAQPPAGAGEPALPGAEGPPAPSDDEIVELSQFSEAVQLTALVEFVSDELGINVTIKGDLPGAVTIKSPLGVRRGELLRFLDMLLEQQGWTITRDRFGFYVVQAAGEVRPAIGDEQATTRVISTPNLRPSALSQAIQNSLQGAGGGRQYAYIDELGVIVATDTPRRLDALETLVNRLLEQFARSEFIRLNLTHISAPRARERALQLIGQLAQPFASVLPGQAPAQVQTPPGTSLNNLGERLTVDPQGNALIFRGLPTEIAMVREVLAIIDVPNELVPRQYFAGSAARQVADIARGQGLGEVTTIISQASQFAQGQPPQAQVGLGGPVMVVDETRGTIVYYGTPQQQERLDALIKELDTKSERVVIEVYKLRNSDAETVAEVVNNIVNNTQALGNAPLLPDGRGNRGQAQQVQQPALFTGEGLPSDGTGLSVEGGAFVIADVANNQVLVKARAGQQQAFARLIERLDLRRPQVYIEAQIVAVTASEDFRLAFETQLINANGSGGVLNTNFGLSSFPNTGAQPILNRRTVSSGLQGLTAAIIRSDQVPIIMTALANNTDSRVVAKPQLLVDDNESATVATVDERPTTTISRGTDGSGDIVTSGDPATATTELTVTPQIAEGGYMRLEYAITLEAFTGPAQTIGGTVLPPPKQSNTINSDSITVPDDATIVIGGLVLDSTSKGVVKVPLLGDIPIVGLLFQDRTEEQRQTTLYVFLTPRILRDPGFEDLRLLTRGPQAQADVPRDLPELAPSRMQIGPGPARGTPEPAPTEAPAPATQEQATPRSTSSEREQRDSSSPRRRAVRPLDD